MQLLKRLKDVGIDAKLDQKEYGAYQVSCGLGKFDSLGFGPLTPFPEPDQEHAAVHHSITRSARSNSDGGIVRPSALAVLRLMTSSNFVVCSTGRSPGFAPFRILST